MPEIKLRIAGQILSVLVGQSESRNLADRSHDIAHSLALAEELIRRGTASAAPSATALPTTPSLKGKTVDAADRDPPVRADDRTLH